MPAKLKLPQFGKLELLKRLKLSNLPTPKNKFLFFLLVAAAFFILYFLFVKKIFPFNLDYLSPRDIAKHYEKTPAPLVPTPTPTPKPLTFAEMNVLYGPCVYLPTLMYHHIQEASAAAEKKQTSLTVDTEYFQKQMQYLKNKEYQTLTMKDLVSFFDNGTPVPKKSILITFDDGYDDFYSNAFPILKELGFKSTIFVPTGLIDNPGYLSWTQILEMSSTGLIFVANHTWSHKNVGSNKDVVRNEINTADFQLSEKSLNFPKVFAYPYGVASKFGEEVLKELDYKLGFTTNHGTALCKKLRLELPRIRIGNVDLSNYGF
jgi:peptidoglycan/xylan/chitin deacetylase (PgdA/CDA1 family)